jgi:hypothetical protein
MARVVSTKYVVSRDMSNREDTEPPVGLRTRLTINLIEILRAIQGCAWSGLPFIGNDSKQSSFRYGILSAYMRYSLLPIAWSLSRWSKQRVDSGHGVLAAHTLPTASLHVYNGKVCCHRSRTQPVAQRTLQMPKLTGLVHDNRHTRLLVRFIVDRPEGRI